MRILVSLFITLILSSCAGTHGYIKSYRYPVSKYRLEQAVKKVITASDLVTQGREKNYYNDDTNYVSITITHGKGQYTYTFRYYGDRPYWDESTTSSIFIAYAYDEQHNGGSEGNGDIDKELKAKLIPPFEQSFILKLDEELGYEHTEEP
jgi:hypothetical protein